LRSPQVINLSGWPICFQGCWMLDVPSGGGVSYVPTPRNPDSPRLPSVTKYRLCNYTNTQKKKLTSSITIVNWRRLLWARPYGCAVALFCFRFGSAPAVITGIQFWSWRGSRPVQAQFRCNSLDWSLPLLLLEKDSDFITNPAG
jgi:hypothetical protein